MTRGLVTDAAGGPFGAALKVSASGTCDEVSRRLGLVPDVCHEKGSLTSPRNPASMRRARTVWLLEGGLPDDVALAEHLRELLARLAGRLDAVRSLAAEDDVEVSCLVGSGTTLDADVLRAMADLGVPIVLDVYPPASRGTGKTTVVTYTTAAGEVLGGDPGVDEAAGAQLMAVAGRYDTAPGGRWELACTSDSGQGGIELDADALRRLGEIGAPLAVRLG